MCIRDRVAASGWLLSDMGIAPEIVRQAIPFLYAMAAGLPALMGFVAMRVFLQGTHRVKAVAFAMVSANVINFAGNYALIYGHLSLIHISSKTATTYAKSACVGRGRKLGEKT